MLGGLALHSRTSRESSANQAREAVNRNFRFANRIIPRRRLDKSEIDRSDRSWHEPADRNRLDRSDVESMA